MKKVMLTVSAFALVAMFAACGGNAKSDGEAMAKKLCECQKMENPEDAAKCGEEATKMAKDHEGKYAKDSVATVEYAKAMAAEMEKCAPKGE